MAIEEVTAWQVVPADNIAHHPTGPQGNDAVRISSSFRELQAAIARWRDTVGGAVPQLIFTTEETAEDGNPMERWVVDTANADHDWYISRGIQRVGTTWELGKANTSPTGIFFNGDATQNGIIVVAAGNHNSLAAGANVGRPEDFPAVLELSGLVGICRLSTNGTTRLTANDTEVIIRDQLRLSGTDATIIATASTTTGGAIRIPHGVAKTTPVDGDFWSTTAGFFGRVNGATVGPFSSGGGIGGSITNDQIAVGAATANDIEGTAALSWVNSTNVLTIGDSTVVAPKVELKAATNGNIEILFQEAGTTKGRVAWYSSVAGNTDVMRIGSYVNSATETQSILELVGDNLVQARLSQGGMSIVNGLRLTERAAAAFNDTAGEGQMFVKDDVPNSLVFRDDAGNETVLAGAGSQPAGSREFISETSITAVASFDITWDETVYNKIEFVIEDMQVGTDAVHLEVRLGHTDGGTIISSANYSVVFNSGLSTWTSSTGQAQIRLTGSGAVGNAAGEFIQGEIVVKNFTSANGTASVEGRVNYDNTAGAVLDNQVFGRLLASANAYDTMQFRLSSGNFAASGTVRMYGYRI